MLIIAIEKIVINNFAKITKIVIYLLQQKSDNERCWQNSDSFGVKA